MNTKEKQGEIIIYRSEDGKAILDVRLEQETVWLNVHHMATLFGRDRSVVVKHIRNIFLSKELDRKSTCAKIAQVAKDGKMRAMEMYNLDVIIAVGYRVNSKRGTQFRIWATDILRDHIVKGYTLNQKRLQEQNRKHIQELEEAVMLVKGTQETKQLSPSEVSGLLTVITEYTRSWLLLHQYDTASLPTRHLNRKILYEITEGEALKAIAALREELMRRNEASDLFGGESQRSKLKGILVGINQTFAGKELYPSIEEKAAHLLYFIIKDHPFVDGNKRIASLLFIWFLEKNGCLSRNSGDRKINDNALVALALLVAESDPKQKDMMIKLIINLIGT